MRNAPAGGHGPCRRRLAGLGSLLLTLVAACSGGEGSIAEIATFDEPTDADAETATAEAAESGLRPCSEDRHLAAFDIVGLLTSENIEALGPWVEEGIPPTPRPGSVEVVRAYRERGYEILYITTVPPDLFAGQSVVDVATLWLATNGYPVDEGTHVWAWDGVEQADQQTWLSITDELLRLAGEGVSVDFGYTENVDKAFALATGGVPEEGLYTLTAVEGLSEAAPTSAPTTPIPADDLVAHAATVQALPPVCEVG